MRVRLFAALREIASSAWVDAPDAPDVRSLVDALTQRFGGRFGRIVQAGTVVVNGTMAGPERALAPGDDVALLPPVSGGADRPERRSTVVGQSTARTVRR